MKIIQANKYFYPRGGAETYMLSLFDWLEQQGSTVIPFAMQHEDNLPSEFQKYFVSRVLTETSDSISFFQKLKTFGRMMYSFEARRNMSRLISTEHPDLCHIHNIYTQISPSILSTLAQHRVPMVMTVHDHHLISPQYNVWAPGCGEDYRNIGIIRGTFSKFHKRSFSASFAQVASYKFHRWLRLYEKNVGLFIAPSYYLKRQLIAGGFPNEKIRVNHYGIDVRRAEPSYEHNGSFLYVGRLSEEKGIEMIIYVAKQLPEISFKIVGRGPQMAYLHRLAIDAPNVEFLGYRSGDELKELYQQACAVLLPSRVHEVFPLVTLEAMAYGKPVVASDVGGMSEVVEDRINGFLMQPTDLHGWIESVLRLAYDKDLQRQMALNARDMVEHKFRLEDHYRRLENCYREVGK